MFLNIMREDYHLVGDFAARGSSVLRKIDDRDKRTPCGHIYATFQDISREVKACAQTGLLIEQLP